MAGGTPDDLAERASADLTAARRERDPVRTSALRTLLAALANAEAPGFDAAEHREGRGELVEHARLELSPADHQQVLEAEIARRQQLLAGVADTGVPASYLGEIEGELAVLRSYRA